MDRGWGGPTTSKTVSVQDSRLLKTHLPTDRRHDDWLDPHTCVILNDVREQTSGLTHHREVSVWGGEQNARDRTSRTFVLVDCVCARRLQWLVHIMCMDPDRLVHKSVCTPLIWKPLVGGRPPYGRVPKMDVGGDETATGKPWRVEVEGEDPESEIGCLGCCKRHSHTRQTQTHQKHGEQSGVHYVPRQRAKLSDEKR